MADRVIDLLIKVKHDGGRELNELAKGLMKTAGVATAAFAKLAWDAAPLEGVEQAFRGIAESSGESADAMLAALDRGSAGMVRQRDLMMTYNTAAQLVSKQFANQLPQAMQYLGKVSLATGQDMGFLLDSLVKGVGRLSPMILDNLAIQVSLADATERASQMFGVQAGELTKAQTQAGMMNVVLAKLAENTAAMPDVMGSAAQKTGEFSAKLADVKDKAGMMALPALKAVLDVVNSLNDDTVALTLGLGSAAAMMVKFSGGLGGMASALGTTKLGLGAATAAVGAWIIAWEKWQDLQNEVEKGVKDSGEAIAGWTGIAEEMLASGEDMSAVMDELAGKVNEASDAFHWDGNVLEDVAAAYARTKGEAKVMGAAQEEIHDIILRNTTTWGEYIGLVDQYNGAMGRSGNMIRGWSEESYEAWRADQEFGASVAMTAALVAEQQAAVESQTVAMETYRVRMFMATRDLTVHTGAVREFTQRQAEATVSMKEQVSQQLLAEQQLAAYGNAARNVATEVLGFATAQADASERAAAHQQAVLESAQSYANLAASLKDATDAQIANTLIGMLDPEEMGAASFTLAVTEIGTAFGTMDAESIALAGSLGELANAIERGLVPAENADEALSALITDAEDGEVKISELIATFDRYPNPADKATGSTEALAFKFEDMMEASDIAAGSVDGLTQAVGDLAGPTSTAAGEVSALEQRLTSLAKEYTVTVRINTVGRLPTGAVPEFQMGMWRVPYDNMLARLHRGEMVVPRTAAEVLRGERAGRAGGLGGNLIFNAPLVGSATIRDERDVQLLAELVADELAARTRGRGAVR